MTQTGTLQDFIDKNGIKITSKYLDLRRDPDGWEHHAYKVTLRNQAGRRIQVPWRQGTCITEDPRVTTVLDCLASDATTYENADGFEDWANELGFDTDSRKAEAIYGQIERQTLRLRAWLGEDAYQTLLWQTERE